jgi:hypothetical protein
MAHYRATHSRTGATMNRLGLILLLAFPLAAAAQSFGEPPPAVTGETTNKPGQSLLDGARENVRATGKAVGKSASDVSSGARQGAAAVAEGAQKGAKAVRERLKSDK